MSGATTDVHDVLTKFPRERRWLLPALHALQDAHGYLASDALLAASAHLRVPASEVYGVATHYPELRLAPRGRHHVRACTGVTCALAGGRSVLAALDRRFGDGRNGGGADDVTVERADCVFACSVAPVVEVDGAYHGRVDVDAVARIEPWFRDAPPGFRIARDVPAYPALDGAPSATAALDRLVDGVTARRATRALRLLVQTGTCGRAVGGEDVLSALRAAVVRRGIDAEVIDGACNGMCYAAPVVAVVAGRSPRFVVERVVPDRVDALLDVVGRDDASFASAGFAGVAWTPETWRGLAPAATHPFWRVQERLLLRRAGFIDPTSLDDALAHGAYRSLARALDGAPDAVIDEVKRSGLQGRGGAFFPAAVKWNGCRNATGTPKYLVMNGEEGEPGIFKDRHLIEADPHQTLEGALIAAYAAGATRVILYLHGEANLAAARLAHAVAEATRAGIVGPQMLGRDVSCEIELRRGAGGFVLGEETALLESIEGRRAQPRTRPPFPVESGLWGRPTVINNVETLAAVPSILELGAARFAALGIASAPGTKVFGLSGPIARSGVVEARNGVTLRTLLNEIGGGVVDGRGVKGALVGGPSGTVVPAALFDVPMEPRGRVSPGTGGVVAVPEDASIVEIVTTLLAFNATESCGKCTPCREGAPRLLAMIDELRASPTATLPKLRDLADTLQLASLCGLGQAAPLALLRALETFPEEFNIQKGSA